MTILAVLIAVVLGALLWHSKRPTSPQRSAAAAAPSPESSAPNAAPSAAVPAEPAAVPWVDRADTVVTNMLNANGAGLAKAIKAIIHPMGPSDASLANFEVRRAGTGLSVLLTIGWNGGMGLGDYTTTVVWNFDRRRHHQATVYSDSSPFAAKNAGQLDQYFRDQVYPSVMTAIGD